MIVVLVVIAAKIGNNLYTTSVVAAADRYDDLAYTAYVHGDFATASNQLRQVIVFVNRYRKRLSRNRDTQLMLLSAHHKMAYMMLYAGNADAAYQHFTNAYAYYAEVNVRAPVDRAHYIEYIVSAMEEMGGNNVFRWKGESEIDKDTLNKVAKWFAEHRVDWKRVRDD